MKSMGSGFLYDAYICCIWEMGLGKSGRKKTSGMQKEKDAGVTSYL